MDQLAINGGPKAKTTPYGTGKRYLDNELKYLQETLEQNTLFYGFGKMVKTACAQMAEYTGVPHVVPCSSGSAAIHLGLAACGIGPGDEVITTPNTDYGTVIGIITEGAVPVFCDCDDTMQPSLASIQARVTERTRAVIVVHLAGYPAAADEITAWCHSRGIGVVEDCAQSWGARLRGQLVGSFGDAGCYSTNDFKHLSTGDGGFVVLRDAELYRRVSNYADKCYDRLFDRSRVGAHHAMNYRMTELQGAVAIAQLEKAERITGRHHELGERLRAHLRPLRGARLVEPGPDAYCTYWWTALVVAPEQVTATRDQLVAALQAEGLGCNTMSKYDLIQAPIFQRRSVRPWLTDRRAAYPLVQPDGREYTYDYTHTPTHKNFLQNGIMVSMGAFYRDQDIDETAAGILKVLVAYQRPA